MQEDLNIQQDDYKNIPSNLWVPYKVEYFLTDRLLAS